MSRFVRDLELDQPIDVVSMVMDDYLFHHQFIRTDWNGEMVFSLRDKYGNQRYLKWSYVNRVFHLEAWVKNLFGGESDLRGAGLGRSEFRRDLNRLLERLKTQNAAQLSGGHIGEDPLHHSNDYEAEHTFHKTNPTQVYPQAGDTQSVDFGEIPETVGTDKTQDETKLWFMVIFAVVFCLAGSFIGLILAAVVIQRASRLHSERGSKMRLLCIVAIVIFMVRIMATFGIGIVSLL